MRTLSRIPLVLTLLVMSAGGWNAQAQETQPAAPESSAAQTLRDEATALKPLVESSLAKSFLSATRCLPEIAPRTIYRDETTRKYYSKAVADKLGKEARDALKEVAIDDSRYYLTKYGSPMAYARAVDLLGKHGIESFDGKKILDFGYGTVGHLRLFASNGADVIGLDVDSFLTALYSEPGDTGKINGSCGAPGSIALVSGQFSDEDVKSAVGDGYDLIISKNTLKKGYVAPPADQEVDKRMLIDLGISNDEFLKTVFDRLKPGGRFMIYNICPKQGDAAKGEKYLPMADGHCPWDREALEKQGFKIVAMDVDDSAATCTQGKALGWDQGEQPMDLENDLFAWYTIVEKPR